ncbi:MAG: hypothetical protein ACE5JM_05140 [Armatimonadota bacterium]
MKRISLCLVLLAIGVAAVADTQRSVRRVSPALQPTGVRAAQRIRLSPTVKASLERPDAKLRSAAMRGLNLTDKSRLQRVVSQLKGGNQAAAQREWRSLLSGRRTGGIPMDINSLIQYVLRRSYIETNKDLQFYASKVQQFNEAKKAIRDHLTDARDKRAEQGRTGRSSVLKPAEFRPVTVREPVLLRTGKTPPKLSYRKKTLRSRSEWEAYIKELEQKLSTLGDDAQLANMDLQNALQKQQQTLQLMSNVSKMLHDTAMAIIRKIG